jgi:hypothetical protein
LYCNYLAFACLNDDEAPPHAALNSRTKLEAFIGQLMLVELESLIFVQSFAGAPLLQHRNKAADQKPMAP